jgi:phospholipase C
VKTLLACLLAVALAAPGCSSSESDGGSAPDTGPPRPTDEAAAQARGACEFGIGAPAHETLGASDPVGAAIPIEHVIVLMMENRSFDHYFSQLPAYGQPDVTVADSSFVNPDAAGGTVTWFKTGDYCVEDPAHGWTSVHEQYNGGKNDGFVLTNEPDGARAMGYFDQADIPFYYELASTFAISDRHFSSLLGPTWPNRMFLYSGSSHGLTLNTLPSEPGTPNVFRELADAGVTWRTYRSDLAPGAVFLDDWFELTKPCTLGEEPCPLRAIERLVPDIAAGDLPAMTFVDPEYSGVTQTSEHPPANPQIGQHFVWELVNALTQSPIWHKSALIITYDEHGGFADHVPPPPACHPGTGDPVNADAAALGTFDRLGIRVPLMVVSPFAKKHFVSHTVTDHASVLRFIQARFGLPALSGRDANASALMDLFDFENPPHASAPTFAEPAIDPEKVAECAALFPGG